MRSAGILSLFAILLIGNSALANPVSPLDQIETLNARANLLNVGKTCSTSTQCKSGYCHHANCDTKKDVGKSCYKDVGCISGKCGTNGKCASSSSLGRKLGSSCSESTQCASGYCGHSKCSAKVANGKSCYRSAGCTSGFCVQSVCSGKAGTSTPVNYADFSSGTLGSWTGTPANKVRVVADAASPGGHVARLTAGRGEETTIARTNFNAAKRNNDETTSLDKRQVGRSFYYLKALFEFRITDYQAFVTVDPDAQSGYGTGCSANFIINGENPGGQSIGDARQMAEKNVWYPMSNGILTTANQISSLHLGPYCGENAQMTFDIRNVTQSAEFAYTSLE